MLQHVWHLWLSSCLLYHEEMLKGDVTEKDGKYL